MVLKTAAWQQIGAPSHVIDWITNGVPIIGRGECDIQSFELENSQLGYNKVNFVHDEIERLLQIDAIEKCVYKPKCVSPINVVAKRQGKHRLVIDLRRLNTACDSPRFTNEDIRTVKSLIKKGDKLATVDLSDGFLHVPVHKNYRDLLGFRWQNVYYRYKKLPFGLCLSPFYFAKIIRPIIQYLRSHGIRVVAFVDDFLLMSKGSTFTDHCDLLIQTLEDLGWNINLEKSSIMPKTSIVYLGHKVTSEGLSGFPEIAITSERIRKLKRALRITLSKSSLTARRLASITGQCVAMSQVILPAKLLLRASYRLLRQRQSWDSLLEISPEVTAEMTWWLQYVSDWNVCPVVVRPIEMQLITDASHIGWGATLEGRRASGQWNKRLSRQSSNFREIMAILMALQAFKEIIRNKSVQVLTDNITALAYISNKGGPVAELTNIACAIWNLCCAVNIHIQIGHIKGLRNVEADFLSRIIDNYNWRLHPKLFQMIDNMFGPHTIDRFASGINTQLTRFNSRFWEPHTEGIDALSQQNWGTEMNFVNAPFRLIPRILDIIKTQQAEATIIAPVWPGQYWFHRLTQMTVALPLRIPNSRQAIRFMGATPEPLRNRKWKIYAWRVSGKTG